MINTSRRLLHQALPVVGLLTLLAAPLLVSGQVAGFKDTLGAAEGPVKSTGAPAEFSSALVPGEKAGEVVLKISAKLAPEHYVYSTNESQGAATRITFSREEGLEPIDEEFIADHEPKKLFDQDLMEHVEKFYDKVTWSRRYRLTSSAGAQVTGLVRYQVCDSHSCRLMKYPFEVKLAAADARAPKLSDGSRSNPARSTGTSQTPGDRQTRFEQIVEREDSKELGGTWTVSISPQQAAPGDEVTITVRVELQPNWHVYPLDLEATDEGGSLPTVIKVNETPGLVATDAMFSWPPPKQSLDPANPTKFERYHEGTVEWKRRYRVAESTEAGSISLAGKVAWQMCNPKTCLLAKGFEFQGELAIGEPADPKPALLAISSTLDFPEAVQVINDLRLVKVAAAPAAVATSAAAPSRSAPSAAPTRAQEAQPPKETLAERFGVQEGSSAPPDSLSRFKAQGLRLFLMTAALAGFAALLTPCVFPMIPITVSFFQKQSEKQHHRPVNMALVYCLGIIGTYTGLGMLLSIIFGAGALNQASNSPWFNLGLAAVLVFFALNLLGLFEIRIPSWLLTYTAGQESRGGYVGALFMALTFTLTSFTCTFAFAGLLLPAAAKGDWLWPTLGLLAFSAAFSLPFFFLAIFPSYLQKLPKSGGWMNVVKVLMGLLELGAAFKFLGTADQTWNGQPAIFDFQSMIAIWTVIAVATGLYLLGLFRLPHDVPADHIGVIRFVAAMGFFWFGAYLGAGLFAAQRPQGRVWKYVEAFANSTFDVGSDPSGPYRQHGALKYALDFQRAFDFALSENKPLFLDFTGVNCTNCRFMENGPMSQPAIEQRLGKFVRIQLFTDAVPLPDRAEARRLRDFNLNLQEGWFGNVTLPSYVVIPPDKAVLADRAKILSYFEGVGNEQQFGQFLDEGWSRWQQMATTRPGRQVGQR
jgi:thiol:disulfide interchange protein DsbD